MCDMAAACRSTGFLGSPLLAMEERGKLASYKDLCPPPAHRSRLPHALSSGKNPRRSSRGSDGAGPFSSSGLAAGEYSPLGMVEQADEEGREGGGADPSTAQVSHGQSQARDKKTSVAVKMGLRLHGLTSIAMARNQNDRNRGGGETASALRNAVDSNFAHSSAVRDFNESMPVHKLTVLYIMYSPLSVAAIYHLCHSNSLPFPSHAYVHACGRVHALPSDGGAAFWLHALLRNGGVQRPQRSRGPRQAEESCAEGPRMWWRGQLTI